jgi:hypothetical protein
VVFQLRSKYANPLSPLNTLSVHVISQDFSNKTKFRHHRESCSASVYFVHSPSREPSQAKHGSGLLSLCIQDHWRTYPPIPR